VAKQDKKRHQRQPWQPRTVPMATKGKVIPRAGAPGITMALRDLLGVVLLFVCIGGALHYILSPKIKIYFQTLIDDQGPYSSAQFSLENVGPLKIHHVQYSCEIMNYFLGEGEREDLKRKRRPVVSLPQSEIAEIPRHGSQSVTCTFPVNITELVGFELSLRISYAPQFLKWLPRSEALRFRITKPPEGGYTLVEVGEAHD